MASDIGNQPGLVPAPILPSADAGSLCSECPPALWVWRNQCRAEGQLLPCVVLGALRASAKPDSDFFLAFLHGKRQEMVLCRGDAARGSWSPSLGSAQRCQNSNPVPEDAAQALVDRVASPCAVT